MPSTGVKCAAITAGAIIAACLIVYVAFVAGEHHQRPVTVLSGTAYLGESGDTHQAIVATTEAVGSPVQLDQSQSYGLQGSVMWFDRAGTLHDSSWPACLSGKRGRAVPITFGGVKATSPDGKTSWWQVVWVQCRS